MGGAVSSQSLNPVKVDLPTHSYAVHLDVGGDASCAILENGALYCWGELWGVTPVSVSLPEGRLALSVAVSHYKACALLDDASLYCFDDGGSTLISFPTAAKPLSIDGGGFPICSLRSRASLASCRTDDEIHRPTLRKLLSLMVKTLR